MRRGAHARWVGGVGDARGVVRTTLYGTAAVRAGLERLTP
jgi:hypothetical protein